VTVCAECGQDNPDGARFCNACGATLAEEAHPRRLEERKIVTVLFCDLVGSTARAERLDPEDVRALLSSYHEHVRRDLERHGGTVEKFIGDAVMALFGAPVAHEDDPERAVRAGLAIRDWAREEGEFDIRIGITSGEALVSVGARPEAGEAMASGDVVNTGARLESAAPTNGILVDETTYRATEPVFDYREAEPVEAKGKSEAMAVWEPMAATAIAGVELRPETRLIGRERERDLLMDALGRVRRESSPQLVTLVGVPGIGKSRLVAELYDEVDRDPDLIFWRQGRSLPYGEGVAYWAFAEMVKAQAGVLNSDSEDAVSSKLHEAVSAVVEDADAEYVESRLQPLVGLGKPSDNRDESFGAWRRFIEALCEQRHTVLVFEDLHWADDDLLDFVDYLVDWAQGVPLLVVGTARPELLDRRPGWGGGKLNALTVSLSPLDATETAKLIAGLLQTPVLAAETQKELLQRAGGNPLYAEQFARMLAERGEVGELPENIQGIIAARLDALAPEEKALLQDASVIGRAFWPGALEAVSGVGRAEAEALLHGLARKEFVRRERRSSVERETEYAFAHVLVRDVAYSQIPRAGRTERHLAAAAWIESLGRTEDRAELLAHHYLAALELIRAARGDVSAISDRALAALLAASRRARKLIALGQALRYAGEALSLLAPDDRRRPEVLFELGVIELDLGMLEALEHLDQARELFEDCGDPESAARALTAASQALWNYGRRDDSHAAVAQALALVQDGGPSLAKVHALAARARLLMLGSEPREAAELASGALQVAEQLGDEAIQPNILITLGTAREHIGEGGVRDIERGIELADRLNLPVQFQRGHNNVAEFAIERGDLAEALRRYELAMERVERLGFLGSAAWILAQRAALEYFLGDWSAVDNDLERFRSIVASGPGHVLESLEALIRATLAHARDADDAGALWDAALEDGRQRRDPQVLGVSLSGYARFAADVGRRAEASDLIDELLPMPLYYVVMIDLGWVLHDLGRPGDYPQHVESGVWGEAGALIARGELDTAVEVLAGTDLKLEEMYARLRTGREENVRQALDFYRPVGATHYILEGEAMLAATA
jgi:class 3 adenylate cyclase/tetratricopeptide (TPR) repeat protein